MTVRIVSTSGEPFKDRQEAGRILAEELKALSGENVVVLGIPRGGIVVAYELAKRLGGELDIVLARKLRTPGQPELAMGSVTEDGKIFLNREVIAISSVTQRQIEEEKTAQLGEIKRRVSLIRRVRPKVPLKDRTVIVTDDGVATGATTQAALWAVRHENPKKLIAAFPVGPADTIESLSNDVDEMICLRTPRFFAAVGQFYTRFDPVEDEQVLEILKLAYQNLRRKIEDKNTG